MFEFDRDFTLKALKSLSFARNYKRNIFEREIKPFIGNVVLEVGSGIGIFADFLISSKAHLVILTDADDSFLKILKKNFSIPKVIVEKLDMNYEIDGRFNLLNIDTVIANHVIEHTNDDVSLYNISRILVPGGFFILRVPAFNIFYNRIDKRFGHVKRYTKKTLQDSLKRHGFETLICEYRDAFKIFPWIIFGFSDLTSDLLFSQAVIELMDKIYGRFKFVFDVSLPFGADIYCVARKAL